MLIDHRMIKVSDSYSLEDLCDMSEADMAKLLEYYEPDEVPSLGQLRGDEEVDDFVPPEFDGSFGFCVGC